MDKNQTTGVAERVLYGALLWLAMKCVQLGWFDADTAAYIAAGGVTLAGSAWAWWTNRPAALVKSVSAMPAVKAIAVSDPALARAAAAADPATDVVVTPT